MSALFEFLKDNNGEKEGNDVYAAPTPFFYTAPGGNSVQVDRLVICYYNKDSGSEAYGGILLPNGVNVMLNGVSIIPMKVKKISTYRMYGANIDVFGHHVQIILDFVNGVTVNPGSTFSVVLNDDFTHLDSHTFFITGEVL